jgi:hypothetical protein
MMERVTNKDLGIETVVSEHHGPSSSHKDQAIKQKDYSSDSGSKNVFEV